jgi:hypothetical protein
VIGTLAGAACGAFAGSALMHATSGRGGSIRVGRGAMIGHVTGNLAKLAIGGAIWITLGVAACR